MDVDVRLWRSFTTVAEELHYGRAAERLHITQPALSRQIRDLERALGVTLFDRTSRRVVLSQAGRAVLGQARRALAESDRAVRLARLAAHVQEAAVRTHRKRLRGAQDRIEGAVGGVGRHALETALL